MIKIIFLLIILSVNCHLFIPHGVHSVRPFMEESKLRGMVNDQIPNQECNMNDGPFCYQMESVGTANLTRSKTALKAKNDKRYMASNDEGRNTVGIQVIEHNPIFLLSFVTYDNLTKFSAPNGDFIKDQIMERIFIKPMPNGVKNAEIIFANPIIVTSRFDEGLATPDNFTHPQVARSESYPDGAFGYSPILPMELRFRRPTQIKSMYLKKHRAPDFYLKTSAGTFAIKGYLNGAMALNASIVATSTEWRQYTPSEYLIVDRLVLSPGLDLDNLFIGVEIRSEEAMIAKQNARDKHMNFLIEKSFILSKPSSDAGVRQAQGYNLQTTPPTEAPVAQESTNAQTDVLKELANQDVLSSQEEAELQAMRDDHPEATRLNIMQPSNWKATQSDLESESARMAAQQLHEQNSLLYLALDFMTFVEYRNFLPPDTFYYEKAIFLKLLDVQEAQTVGQNFHQGTKTTNKNAEKTQAAAILSGGFEELKLTKTLISSLSELMIQYKTTFKKEDEKSKLLSRQELKDSIFDAKIVKAHKIQNLKYFNQKDLKIVEHRNLIELQLKLIQGEIEFEEYGEAYLVMHDQVFRSYPRMSTTRLDIGTEVLREALRIQKQFYEAVQTFWTSEQKQSMIANIQADLQKIDDAKIKANELLQELERKIEKLKKENTTAKKLKKTTKKKKPIGKKEKAGVPSVINLIKSILQIEKVPPELFVILQDIVVILDEIHDIHKSESGAENLEPLHTSFQNLAQQLYKQMRQINSDHHRKIKQDEDFEDKIQNQVDQTLNQVKKVAQKGEQTRETRVQQAFEVLKEILTAFQDHILMEKVDQKMDEAGEQQDIFQAFYHHSDEPEEGLGLGSVISHIDHESWAPGIFTGSKVLIYDFQRGEGIKGVIINKQRAGFYIGGPVGLSRSRLQSERIFLHNIPNLANSKKVIQGVFWHDGSEAELEQYKNNPEYQIREYWGYASWFEGQLDGEIQAGGWNLRNDLTAEEVFKDYS